MTFHAPQQFRCTTTQKFQGNNGLFSFALHKGHNHTDITCQASDGGGWEKVTVYLNDCSRLPMQWELQEVKNLFWDNADTVLQYYTVETRNNNGYVHLFRPAMGHVPMPPRQELF